MSNYCRHNLYFDYKYKFHCDIKAPMETTSHRQCNVTIVSNHILQGDIKLTETFYEGFFHSTINQG